MCFMSSGYWHALVFFFGSYFFFQGDTLGPAMWVGKRSERIEHARKSYFGVISCHLSKKTL